MQTKEKAEEHDLLTVSLKASWDAKNVLEEWKKIPQPDLQGSFLRTVIKVLIISKIQFFTTTKNHNLKCNL